MMIAMFVTSFLKKDLRLIRLCPFFERFFIFSGPGGFRQKIAKFGLNGTSLFGAT